MLLNCHICWSLAHLQTVFDVQLLIRNGFTVYVSGVIAVS